MIETLYHFLDKYEDDLTRLLISGMKSPGLVFNETTILAYESHQDITLHYVIVGNVLLGIIR